MTTWGNNHEAMSCMKGVRMLLGVSGGAYVALTTDGHVRVWGDETAGGDSSTSAGTLSGLPMHVGTFSDCM